MSGKPIKVKMPEYLHHIYNSLNEESQTGFKMCWNALTVLSDQQQRVITNEAYSVSKPFYESNQNKVATTIRAEFGRAFALGVAIGRTEKEINEQVKSNLEKNGL
jgi:hypothetical protein